MIAATTRSQIAVAAAALAVSCLWPAHIAAQERRTTARHRPSSEIAPTDKMITAGAVVSDVLAINPFAFEGLEASDIAALHTSGVGRYCEDSPTLPWALEAPVELASGTAITRFELDAYDASESNLKANLYRCPVGEEVCEFISFVETDGSPGLTTVGVDLGAPEIISNADYTYVVEVYPGESGLTRLIGARLGIKDPEGRPNSDTLAINAYGFEAVGSDDRAVLAALNIQRFCNGAACAMAAPVELPTGSTVERLELDAYDMSSDGVVAEFVRCNIATAMCTSLASVGTGGSPGTTNPGVDLVSPEVIDNSDFVYLVHVTLGATQGTRLGGVRLEFVLPPTLSRTDRLSIAPIAFEAREAGDSALLETQNGERFCSGQPCTMMAPVELPSGTRIDRLEHSAFDNSAEDLRSALYRCPKQSETCAELASVSTNGSPGATTDGTDLSSPETVDNSSFTYMVEVQGGPNADTSLRGVSLSIQRTLIFSDGFGSGDTSAWSSAVP